MKNTFKIFGLSGLFAFTSANAALSIDTTQIMTDIQTAGTSGLSIALAVAGIAIGVALVRKLIRS